MDIDRLRYFTVVARLGSLVKASEILRISPPALSKAMRILEEEVKTELFTRAGRNIAITEEGKRLLPLAEEILKKVESLSSSSLRSQPQTPLRIASFEVFTTYFLGAFLKERAG